MRNAASARAMSARGAKRSERITPIVTNLDFSVLGIANSTPLIIKSPATEREIFRKFNDEMLESGKNSMYNVDVESKII